ncbi:MAG: hypothetical protein JJU41_07060 [Bacteroidetes bacterium]|nr:hypothetical protein [Bacteroidota bacterium]
MQERSNRLYFHIVVTDFFLLSVGVLISFLFLGFTDLVAIMIAVLLTSLYAVIGLWYINAYFDAPPDVFLSKVYGAVAIRLVMLAAAIFVVLKFTNLPEITFTVSVFISYLAKSIQEILFIHRKSAKT